MYMDDSMQFDVCSVSNPLPDTPSPMLSCHTGEQGVNTDLGLRASELEGEVIMREEERGGVSQ